jgi:hypothetical protein
VVKKASFSITERGLVKKGKLQQSGNERGQKFNFSMSGLGKKKEKKVKEVVKKLSKSCQKVQKVVKKLSNISSNLVKINKKR